MMRMYGETSEIRMLQDRVTDERGWKVVRFCGGVYEFDYLNILDYTSGEDPICFWTKAYDLVRREYVEIAFEFDREDLMKRGPIDWEAHVADVRLDVDANSSASYGKKKKGLLARLRRKSRKGKA